MQLFLQRRFGLRPSERLAVLALFLAVAFPVPCRGGESAAAVGYIRTHYKKFGVALLPTKAERRPAGSPNVVVAEAVDGRAPVAPGEYYIANWTVEAEDADGHHWRAKGNMLPDPITIRAGAETRVRLAEPLQAHLLIYGAQDPMGFRLELTGPYGERCREIRVDDQYMPHPKLDLLDSQGRLVERITFQGRCGGTCLTVWPAPPKLKGQFTALPNIDLGPLLVEVGAGITFTLDASRYSVPKAQVGKAAPDFVLTASDATMAQLSFQRGKPVILSFFCSCDLCKAVAVEMSKRVDLKQRARVFAVFSDPAYGDATTCQTFLKETGYPGKLLLDLGAAVTLQYQSPECPRLWVIDANGTIRHATADRTAPAGKIVDDALKALSAR